MWSFGSGIKKCKVKLFQIGRTYGFKLEKLGFKGFAKVFPNDYKRKI